jgi:hypothetical protein
MNRSLENKVALVMPGPEWAWQPHELSPRKERLTFVIGHALAVDGGYTIR